MNPNYPSEKDSPRNPIKPLTSQLPLSKENGFIVPRQALQSLFYSPGNFFSKDMIEKLFACVLKEYSVQQIYSKEVVEEHKKGSICIANIDSPMKIFLFVLSHTLAHGEVFSPKAKKEGEVDWIDVWGEMDALQTFVMEPLVLSGLDEIVPNPKEGYLRSFLAVLSRNFRCLPSCLFWLQNPPSSFTDHLVEVYTKLEKENQRGYLPSVVVPLSKHSFEPVQSGALFRLCELALRSHKVTFQLKTNALTPWAGWQEFPWAFGSIMLNLPQAAYRVGKGNFGDFWEEVRSLCLVAIKAHLDHRRFLLSLLEEGYLSFFSEPPWQGFYEQDKGAFLIEICGLAESIFFLMGVEMDSEEGEHIAIQTLASLREVADANSRQHGIRIVISDYDTKEQPEQKLIRMDKARFPSACESFTEYTRGPRLRLRDSLKHKEQIVKEANLHQYLPSSISFMPDIQPAELLYLLQFAYEETLAYAIKIC